MNNTPSDKPTSNKSTGTFYGVGLGPGDPELLTLKALRVIRDCEVIVVPGSEDGSIASLILERALSSVEAGDGNTLEDKEVLDIRFPMTREAGLLESARDEASDSIAQRLVQGKDVAFVTLGDPMFYSTFSYLIPFVLRKCPEAMVTVVPGVTAPSAASATLKRALCEGDDRVAIIPAVYDPGKVREVLECFDTVVLMKVNKVMEQVVDLLAETGLTSKAVLVSKASWAEEEAVVEVAGLKGTFKPPYFSMIIVRK